MTKWISVEKRLPDKDINNSVLITDGRNIFVAIWSYSDCCGCKASGMTHWMPLPNPTNKEP